MKFAKGCKVEVLCKEEFSWRLAEIVSASRNSCLVKYELYPGVRDEMNVQKVARQAVRPPPPPVAGVDGFDVGDLVEVFDEGSWKAATVLRGRGRKYCEIRFLGSCRELKADRSKIRVRQSWQEKGWTLLKKGFGSSEAGKASKLSNLNCYQKPSSEVLPADLRSNLPVENDYVAGYNNAGFQESHVVSCRTLKRASPYCSSQVEAYAHVSKRKATGNESECPRLVSFQQSAELEKVDAVACPRQFLGDKYMHSSFSNKKGRYYETLKEEPDGPDSLMNHSEHNDSDTDASVGSCSINDDSPNKLHGRILAGHSQDAYACTSDAESCYECGNEEEESLPPVEDVATRIHSLELHAYRRTLAALYAYGSISWEQEALLTNLRLWLHISNDEHLVELKNLISTGVHSR